MNTKPNRLYIKSFKKGNYDIKMSPKDSKVLQVVFPKLDNDRFLFELEFPLYLLRSDVQSFVESQYEVLHELFMALEKASKLKSMEAVVSYFSEDEE